MNREEAIDILGQRETCRECVADCTCKECDEAFEMAIKALEQEPCEDAISRQAAIDILDDVVKDYINENDFDKAQGVAWVKVQKLPSVSTENTDTYKQGWHDAITTALKETHSVHTEEGNFRVVQEETLIGVGMAYEQVSTVLDKIRAEIIENSIEDYEYHGCGSDELIIDTNEALKIIDKYKAESEDKE